MLMKEMTLCDSDAYRFETDFRWERLGGGMLHPTMGPVLSQAVYAQNDPAQAQTGETQARVGQHGLGHEFCI